MTDLITSERKRFLGPSQTALIDCICFLLPLGLFLLWFFSLGNINIQQMTDLGLVSVMPLPTIVALLLITVSFCVTLQRRTFRVPLLVFHVALIIFMLYGVTPLIEQLPRFDIVYRHSGYTEYIQRTGTTNPNLDAYFSWPLFFSLFAFFNSSAGLSYILSYADWAPVALNIFYCFPLYMIFSSFTRDKRIIWLATWFFLLGNWIWQDYFSPQGFNFFLYLVMVAILVKWFKASTAMPRPVLWSRLRRIPFATSVYDWLTAPDPLQSPASPGLRLALLCTFFIVFAFDVGSHQLTPFFSLLSMGALIVCQRIRPWWILIAMLGMQIFWLAVPAQSFVIGHTSMVFSGLHIFSSFGNNVSNRVAGNVDHTFIARIRIYMSMVVWGLAFLGVLLRLLNKERDASMVILAVMPFPLFIVQPYGGEMLLRSYLFSLPAMVFFMAALFYTSPAVLLKRLPLAFLQRPALTFLQRPAWQYIALVLVNLVMISGFLYTRYGNEHEDYITYKEYAGVSYLYSIAPSRSLFMASWLSGPWQYEGYEKYVFDTLASTDPMTNAIEPENLNLIVKYMRQESNGANAYLIFTRSELVRFDATSGLPQGSLLALENAVKKSGYFTIIYKNSDVQIFVLAGSAQGE